MAHPAQIQIEGLWMRIGQVMQGHWEVSVRALGASLLAGLLVCSAFATPEEMERFHGVLQMKESSRILRASCMACHTDPPNHNPFGKELKQTLASQQQQLLDRFILQSVSSKDSDGDGWTNEEEWSNDTLPGDPKSYPAGSPTKTKEKTVETSEASVLTALDPLFPKHSMHPMVVHFPIALFLFGTGLELVGWRRKSDELRRSAWLCLLFGAVAAWLAVPTGLLAFYRVGFAWTGNALTHVLLAGSSTLLMTTLVLWRRRAAHTSTIYFALLSVTAFALATAGHFGALLVYGN